MTPGGRLLSRALPVALIAVLGVTAQASAHAVLVSADPVDGAHLQTSPHEIHLSFSEEISSRFRSLRIVAPDGRAVGGVRVGGSEHALDAIVPRLARGTYAVVWHVLAEDDGHTTSGNVVFGVGVAAAAHRAAADQAGPSLAEVGLRWLRFSCIALLLGGMAVGLVVLRGTKDPSVTAAAAARRRVLTVAATGGGLAAIVGLASGVRQLWTLSSSSGLGAPRPGLVGDLLLTRWGCLWCIEEIALVVLALIALACRRQPAAIRTGASLAVAWVAVVGVCEALGSHSASISPSAVVADAAHILAAALWLGGVAALAVALWPTGAVGRDQARSLAAACRRPFGLLAGGAAAAVALTGLYSAGREVASVDALLTTLYGGALLAKTGVVALVALLGAVNAVLLRSVARGRRRSIVAPLIAAELIAGTGAFLGAAVLTAASPARGPQFAAPRALRLPTLAANVDDVLVSATVRPNRPGDNVLSVLAVSSRRPAPAPIGSVDVVLGDGRRRLQQVEPGRYIATVTLPRAGAAAMSVVVHRSGRALNTRLGWQVEPPDPARPVVVSSRRLATIVDPLALALAAAMAFVGAWAWLKYVVRGSVRRLPLYREESS
jgi:copper transport protein